MAKEQITNHGMFLDTLNVSALIRSHASTKAFIDNKYPISETTEKNDTAGKKLAKVRVLRSKERKGGNNDEY